MRARLIPAILALSLLGACSAGKPPGSERGDPVPPPSFEAPESEPASAPPGGVDEGDTAPVSSEGAVAPAAGGADSGERSNIVVKGPDENLWRSSEQSEEKRRQTMESCYRYARAQTRHDRQIISDQDAAFDDSSFDPTVARIQRQATDFGLKRRERHLIQECLEARGYEPFLE